MNGPEIDKPVTTASAIRVLIVMIVGCALLEVKLYYDLGQTHYENVTSVVGTVSEAPRFIEGNKAETRRYDFKCREFNCRFWISYDALSLAAEDAQVKRAVESIRVGDVLNIYIDEPDEAHLIELYHKTPVVGISSNETVVFAPRNVELAAKKNIMDSMRIVGVIFMVLTAFLGWQVIKYLKDRD